MERLGILGKFAQKSENFPAMDKALRIVDFFPAHQPDFKRLNVSWIARYFTVEAHDLEQLDDPQHHIIDPGGHILLAEWNGQVVGTVALVSIEPGVLELAKMAVDEDFQGQHIGQRLGEEALAQARAMGARQVVLESNRRLTPAIQLYQKLGFRETPLVATPYARADIRMVIDLHPPQPF